MTIIENVANTFLVANAKGGSGKTTLATNLAGWFARQGHTTMLADLDRQQSSLEWLRLRSPTQPYVGSWDVDPHRPAGLANGYTHAVLDTPAGLHGHKLTQALKRVKRVIVPIQPSRFDIQATRNFLDALLEENAIREQHAFVAIVGMRVDVHTRMAAELERFLAEVDLPVLTLLRDTQNYVQAAADGQTIFDLPASRAARDWEQWQPLLRWTESGATLPQAPGS